MLAIVSVSAFAIVLIDQITEKLSFDAAKAAPQPAAPPVNPTKPIADVVADALQRFHLSPTASKPKDFVREAEIVGALAGYLTSAIPGAEVNSEPRLDSSARPDLLVTLGDKRLLVEVKRISRASGILRQQYIAQVAHYIAASGIKETLIYVHSDNPDMELVREEHQLSGINARIIILSPRRDKK